MAMPLAGFYERQPHAFPWGAGDGRVDAAHDAASAAHDLAHMLAGGALPPPRGGVGEQALAAWRAGQPLLHYWSAGGPQVGGLRI